MGVPCLYDINNKENEPRTGNSATVDSKNLDEKRNETPFLLRAPLTPAATRVPRIRMNNGQEIPAFGLGTSKSNSGEVKQAVRDAIDAGYRHIDCAFSHLNEAEIGAAIKEKIDQGIVKRSDLFVVSKLWNTFHQPDQVEAGLRMSLEALGLEYLDLFLIHWPKEFKVGGDRFPIVTRDENGKMVFSDVDICVTWKAMEQLVHKGLVKSIGVANFNGRQLVRILSNATIRPSVNQIEIHPFVKQKKLVDFCRDNDIVVTASSPLKESERHWEKEPTFLQIPNLLEVSKKYKKSVAQIILRWTIQRGIVVIPKSVNRSRIIENLNIFDFYMTEEDMDDIFGSRSRCNSMS